MPYDPNGLGYAGRRSELRPDEKPMSRKALAGTMAGIAMMAFAAAATVGYGVQRANDLNIGSRSAVDGGVLLAHLSQGPR